MISNNRPWFAAAHVKKEHDADMLKKDNEIAALKKLIEDLSAIERRHIFEMARAQALALCAGRLKAAESRLSISDLTLKRNVEPLPTIEYESAHAFNEGDRVRTTKDIATGANPIKAGVRGTVISVPGYENGVCDWYTVSLDDYPSKHGFFILRKHILEHESEAV